MLKGWSHFSPSVSFNHCVSWLTALFLQDSCSLYSKLDRWYFYTFFLLFRVKAASFCLDFDRLLMERWEVLHVALSGGGERAAAQGALEKKLSAKSALYSQHNSTKNWSTCWNFRLYLNFLVLKALCTLVLRFCATSGSDVGGKISVQESSAMGRVSLCEDTVPQVDALLVRIQEASQSVSAVCQPKGIKAAVRSNPYALWQVLIFQEIHPTSHP